MAQKPGFLTERNEFILKSIENFKVNREPALTPFKQRNGYNFLPTHSTPPSGFFKIKNPFEKGIIDGLHMSFCSPTIFATKMKKTAEDEEFEWTIDEIAEVQPANIEICKSQFEIKNDPIEEKKAQSAINEYFEKEHFIVTPEMKSKTNVLPTDAMKKCLFKDSAVQTEMTIPPIVSPELEQILNKFCTYSQDDLDSPCNKAYIMKDESLMRNLFKDEHILKMSNDALSMDYNTLTPVSKSPALSSLMHNQKKYNHGTPSLYNIPSPSSISPISEKSPESLLSPIQLENKKHEKKTVLRNNRISKLLCTTTGKYPFCQSTPERNQPKENCTELKNIEVDSNSRESPLNECYDDFQCNFLNSQTSENIKFSQDMSVDVTRTEFDIIDSPVVINHACSVFGKNSKNFTNIDNDKFDNGLIPLSPMQTSQMETPLKKRSASAKNLSRSFDLPEMNEIKNHSESIKIDSGFTEITTSDLVVDVTKFNRNVSQMNISKHCYNCDNISNLNILNYKRTEDLKCNFCQRQFEIF